MDPASIQRIQTNLVQLFSPYGAYSNHELQTDTAENSESVEESLPTSLSDLPTVPVLKDIADKRKAILELQNAHNLKSYIKGFDRIQGVVCGAVELSEQIATCLEFMHNSSQLLQQALRNPLIHNALPLPHHLHRKAIQTIEDCIWMIKHMEWQPMRYEVDWGKLIPKLQQEVSRLMAVTKESEKHLKEVQDLKLKLQLVLENCHSVKI